MARSAGGIGELRSAAYLSKQGDSQLKKERLTGKYGNSLRLFLVLTAGFTGPADRLVRKSFATDARHGRWAASLQEKLPPLSKGGGAKRRWDCLSP